MEGKEVKCTIKVVFSKIVLIAGIIGGVLLGVLGIVTISGDVPNFFRAPFADWFHTNYHRINFDDTRGFNYPDFWARRYDTIVYEWNTKEAYCVMETNSDYERVPNGFITKKSTHGEQEISLKEFSIKTHYYCVSQDEVHCRGDSYRGHIYMYDSTPFYSAGPLGNQNLRWTILILSIVFIAFGVVMILGELHVPLVTTKFTFFYYGFVKGIIYFAIGFLCMGMSNLFGLFVAIYMWIIGILNCVVGWRALTSFQWKKVGARGTTTIVTRREYI